MSAIYDNWERLVAAVLKKQQLWELFHDHSRSPSVLSEASDLGSSSLRSWSALDDDFANPAGRAPKLVFVSDFSPAIDVKDAYLASSELLGRGTFGSSHAAAMVNGVRIVVKRLNSMCISETDFNRHMAMLGGVKHGNVAALRAYYSSEHERLMLYDYYTHGSVQTLLHGQNGDVDWETRLRIAVGAARGITEIHKQDGGKLVHGNIRVSNVFLNPDQYGCVSDFGLTNMIIATTFNPPAYCYAPEVKNTQSASQASDVYSFGVLLLELITRKPTVGVPGGAPAVDLVKLVTSVRSKLKATKVFDAYLLRLPTIRDQTVKMLQIGMVCIEKSAKKRPKISQVLKMLEDIAVLIPVNRGPVPRKLVFFEDANATFDLDDLLRASAEVLGKGTFGSSYKAVLVNGNTVVVKRFKDRVVTFEDFRDHMEVIGRMRHENIAGVRAYCFNRDERLLVYDYYSEDSVSALLHGKVGSGRTPSVWESRIKIAVGAARAIAHIHTQDGQKLVHGNIKSSNIFLYKQKYVIVSDVGLAKLSGPVSRSNMLDPGYCAPEVTDTRRVTQASDIYSFGVVLLELLSGKMSQTTTGDGEVISLVDWFQSIDRSKWTAEVFDLELLRYENDEDAMVVLRQIAMDCVSTYPEHRPGMSQVLKMLEDIPVNRGPVPRKLVFFEDANATFDLEDLLKASAEVLGKGTFGSSYKAVLENGNTVVVKRFKDRVVTFEDFRDHMEVIGRMRHENIAGVRAYYLNRDEMLLVYDYYSEDSVSALLPGKVGSGRTPLVWESRLKIAVGAARAIAHIHTQDGQKLVHGNIKSSNIFLYKQKYVIVSDVGQAKLSGPVSRSNMLDPGYCAPEVTDTRRVTQASDIYSFGVVLLELLSGKRSQTTTDDGEVISLVDWFQSIDRSTWTAEVFDLELLRFENDEDAMVVLRQIAMDCVSTYPEHRPGMSQVVKMLEEFSGVEPQSSSEDIWEQASIESRLEYILEGLLPTLAA